MSLRTTIQRIAVTARPLVSKRFASGGAQSWNPPTGYLWNEKPLPKGQKRKSPAFEKIAWFGYISFFAFGVAWYYKPNTSLQDWAMVQAKKRMEARGDLPKYIPSADHIARS